MFYASRLVISIYLRRETSLFLVHPTTVSCFVPDHQPEPGEAGKDGITSYRCYAGYPTSKKVAQVASTTSSHHRPGPGLRAHRGHMGHFPDEIPAPGEAYECHLFGKSSRDRGPVERCARLDGCAFCSKFTIGSKEKITYVQETLRLSKSCFSQSMPIPPWTKDTATAATAARRRPGRRSTSPG